MHAVQTFSLLALAGSTLAAPQGWGNWGKWGGEKGGDDQGKDVATEVAVVTAYTTVTWGGNWGQPTPAPTPAPTPVAASQQTPAASMSWSAWSSAAPAPAPSATGSTSGGYMDIVNKWRQNMGMSSLTQDGTLQSNADKTAADGNGQMVHELNQGTMAQVLAPGSPDEFEKVFVGGWLCERSNLPGLNGICGTMSQGWDYNGETGHADILTSGSYSKIGCACVGGIWACDLS
jgi:hypothetical protein